MWGHLEPDTCGVRLCGALQYIAEIAELQGRTEVSCCAWAAASGRLWIERGCTHKRLEDHVGVGACNISRSISAKRCQRSRLCVALLPSDPCVEFLLKLRPWSRFVYGPAFSV